MVDTKRTYHTHLKIWASLLFAQIIFFYLAAQNPAAVVAVENFFELQKYAHQAIVRLVPFSVGDALYILAVPLLIYAIYRLFRKEGRRRFAVGFLLALNAIYFVYQILWGMLYFQAPLMDKLPKEQFQLEEVKRLALEYLERTNESRALVNQDRNGVYKVLNINRVVEEIQKQTNTLPATLNEKEGTGIASMKPSLFSNILSYTGILGYYNPFTAEGQYNPELPSSYLVFTLAHESAHQLGYAREQEASFIAFLCGEKSTNYDLQHNTNWYVLKSLMRYIEPKDPDFNDRLEANFSPALQRDYLYEKNFFRRKESVLINVFQFTNDLFLKSNRQEGSITYNYFTELFVRYKRSETKESHPRTRF